MKYILWILRIVIGVLFIFSGVVKANDPMGLVYKMDEFFEVLNMSFMIPWSFAFSIVMIAFEIVCGVAVLIGASFRFFSLMLVLMNLFFTFLTGYALYSGKIKECGCFGACIKISPEGTFYKDIVLTIISVILYIYRGRVSGLFSKGINGAIVVFAIIFSFGIQWWALKHLPFNDCMPYKPGNSIWERMQPGPDYKPAVITSVFIYAKDGKNQEFTSENYPWQDTTWKFVDRRDKVIKEATGEPDIHDFILNDSDHNDRTEEILTAKGYTLFWFIREIDKAHTVNMETLSALAAKAKALNVPFYVLSSDTREKTLELLWKNNMGTLDILSLDGTASKTAMRANPGLMLMHDGKVAQKWSYADYPKEITMSGGTVNLK